MAKYKIKKKFNKLNSIAIVLIAILFSMSIGYCIWTDNQIIKGIFKVRYVEPKIENIEIDDDNSFSDNDQVYISKNEDMDLAWASKKIDFKDSSIVKTVDANTNRLDIIGNFDIDTGWSVSGRTVTYTFYIRNNNTEPMKQGTFEFLEKTIKYEPSFTIPEEIGVGQIGEFKISMFMIGNGNLDYGKVAYKFHYKIGEVTRYAYVTVDMQK